MGWDVTVFTPENPEIPVRDESLSKDIPSNVNVVTHPIREPYAAYKRFTGKKKKDSLGASFLSEKKNPSKAEKIARWIRGNWFIPDARKFWIKPASKRLITLINEEGYDALVTTGPPHSMHMIGLFAKRATDIKWTADFRDPWTQIDFIDELMLTEKSFAKHEKMERDVLQESDRVLVVSRTMKTMFAESIPAEKIEVIPNGYDEEDFVDVKQEELQEGFVMAHVGSLTPARNPPALWDALAELVNENPQFAENLRLQFVGQIDYSAKSQLEALGLLKHVEIVQYLPHDELMGYLTGSHVLLLLANQTRNAKMILTGKVFEYLKANRPILALAPVDGDLAHLIDNTQSGHVCAFKDKESMKLRIRDLWNAHLEGNLVSNTRDVEQFSRQNLTIRLSAIIEKIE